MSSRTRSRRPASIGSNQSSRRWTAVPASDCRATDFVLLLLMAWSPPARKGRHRLGFNHPETTPPAIPTTPRTAPRIVGRQHEHAVVKIPHRPKVLTLKRAVCCPDLRVREPIKGDGIAGLLRGRAVLRHRADVINRRLRLSRRLRHFKGANEYGCVLSIREQRSGALE